MYDQRLFNQDGGMGHGLSTDDAYNLYDKQLFADRSSTGLHRAKAAADDEGGA
jgi:SNW domain-containing protein 1